MLNDEVLNAAEVAKLLHIGRNAVYELAKSGALPSYRMGRKLLFTVADIEAYLAQVRQGSKSGGDAQRDEGALHSAASLTSRQESFVIAGHGVAADIFVDQLSAQGLPATRVLHDSYHGLIDLYDGSADAAVVHLYDQRTNSYNVPYVQRLVPGWSVVIFRLLQREQGLAVAKGNPKAIASWSALLRPDIRIANRGKGSGSRVLLDEKLLAMDFTAHRIEGYEYEYVSALSAAQSVAAGAANVSVVGEQVAAQVKGIDFVPMQKEWLDLVVIKNERTAPYIAQLKEIMADEGFRDEYARVVHGNASSLGAIVYEC